MGRATDPGPVDSVRRALNVLADGLGFTDATNADIARATGRQPNAKRKSTQVGYALRTLREAGEIRVEYDPAASARRIHLHQG
ncbi:hypothetical protein [Blastococcus mobilis]|uniref:Uncharacterized protein n=1 Tax=Blastococcus mobilis TaxID=1938746 RepID=A0A238VWY8_9ACTN|nr:hypothetical protein [Blastococcus mobilis]SNR38845.1 hypothetical protein SAMN06272737_105129 [Blastococcus mobilis]